MIRAYLAGPMRGKPDWNYPAFDSAAKWLREQHDEVYNPADEDRKDEALMKALADRRDTDELPGGEYNFRYFMAKDLPEVVKSDCLYLLPGWEESQGAKLEQLVAHVCEIPVFELQQDGGSWRANRLYYKASPAHAQPQRVYFSNDDSCASVGCGCAPKPWPKAGEMIPHEDAVIRTFETGATRNLDEHPDIHGFTSPLATAIFARYMHQNRLQADGTYRDSDNWKKGIPIDSYIRSMRRHMQDLELHHTGYGDCAREDLYAAMGGLMFNVQGYMHEIAKMDIEAEREKESDGYTPEELVADMLRWVKEEEEGTT